MIKTRIIISTTTYTSAKYLLYKSKHEWVYNIKLIFNKMSEYNSADEDTILTTSTMGYQDDSNPNMYSLTSNSDTSSTSSSSDGSRIIALTSLSDREYESEESDDSIDLDNWDNYEDDDSIINEIYQKDMDHLDSDKNDGHYYVGIYKHIPKSGNFLYVNSITGSLFTKYGSDKVLEYLRFYSIMLRRCSNIEIMQLYIRKEVYYVVVKTFWIRMIQRHWKKQYQKYVERQHKKMLPQNMRYREIHGKYPKELNYLPKIQGLMSHYKQETLI
jgi:hypothetical protein